MNVPMIDPLQGDFPEIIEDYLQYGSMKCVAFNSHGTLLAAGHSDGNCIIWDFETRGISRKLCDNAAISPITSVCWSKHGHRLLVSATDKSLTLWDVKTCEQITRITLQQTALHAHLDPGLLEPTICLACPLSSAPLLVDLSNGSSTVLPVSVSQEDVVTKIQWKTPCFSGDDEWILGASASKGEHKLYIWERLGHLVKILEGPKEAIIDIVWHPERPIVVSVSVTGTAYVWAKDYVENWSAFAPDFKELEENEEYIEREDEFDINPREDEKEREVMIDEDADVDIESFEETSTINASNGSYEELRYLPAVLSLDVSEQQDKYPASPSKLEESNNSASPFDTDVVANGHASSPMEVGEYSLADEDGSTSKRKRKPSAKGMEMQAEKDRRPISKNPKSSSSNKISKPRTKYEFDSDQDDDFTDGATTFL